MDDLRRTREHLSRQLTEAIAADPIRALPEIVALQKDTEGHLRDAVRRAALNASWREIATELGVSKQAAHQRFSAYAKGVTEEIKAEHKAMKKARRRGDAERAAEARARRDELTAELKTAAGALKDQV